MAKRTAVLNAVAEPEFVSRLSEALRRRLRGSEVEHEHLRGTRYRFIVVWPRFDQMDHPERQQLVWNIAEEVLKGKELLDVSMILTLGREDLPDE